MSVESTNIFFIAELNLIGVAVIRSKNAASQPKTHFMVCSRPLAVQAYSLQSGHSLSGCRSGRPPSDGLVPWRVGCDSLNAEITELPEHFKWKITADYGRYRKVKPNGVLEVAFQFNPAQPHVTLSGLPLRLPGIKSIRRDKDVDPIDTLVTCA